MTSIVVLGCGPAGLIAAQAVHDAGFADLLIVSKKVKSVMPGAQFLHAPVPGISPLGGNDLLCIAKRGSREGYARKVYGDPLHPVSWDVIKCGHHPAWRLSATYDILWENWEPYIFDKAVNSAKAAWWCKEVDFVISTIPANAICRSPLHEFRSQKVWISDDLAEPMSENTILYNGDPRYPWYRQSSIFGKESTEWTSPIPGHMIWSGAKPTFTDCDCAPKNMLKVGRFGKWDKNALLHQVYGEVTDALQRL